MKKLLLSAAAILLSLNLSASEDKNVVQLVQSVSENEMTLSIIKPDAVSEHHIGDIIARFEKAGLHVAAIKMVKLTEEEAGKFYAVHKDKPFFKDLSVYMSSGPIVPIVLEGNSAIAMNRTLMGATDPAQADSGTIRKDFAKSKSINAVHGSDSKDSAKEEIAFFFKPAEIFSK